MKIALCSSYVPFIRGGYRNIVDWLGLELEGAGHQVEKVYLPEADAVGSLFQQMMAYRWVDLEAADRIICFRPQAHIIPHSHKIVWFIHHLRSYYDLWDTPYRGVPNDTRHQGFRDALHAVDNAGLREAKTIFTNSKVVQDRLTRYNEVNSEVLYPPLFQPEKFHCTDFNNEIVYICRVEHHKRQHLLVEAMGHTKTPVRLRLAGMSGGVDYPAHLVQRISELGLTDRVILEKRWIGEEEKVAYLANCLAAAYLPFDEDSYGYPSLEASHASKPILTTSDSGGVLELVEDGINGYVSDASPEALGDAMDRLYLNREKTKQMGQNAHEMLAKLNISWPHVLQKLLA
jgi:glycosyltransferase involved in cell wall biosynthesis